MLSEQALSLYSFISTGGFSRGALPLHCHVRDGRSMKDKQQMLYNLMICLNLEKRHWLISMLSLHYQNLTTLGQSSVFSLPIRTLAR